MKTALQVLLVSVALCLLTTGFAESQWPLGRDIAQGVAKSSEPGPAITVSGRFQMFTSPHLKGHTFMIDTETGRVWIMKKDHLTGDFSMQRISVEQVDSPRQGTETKEPKKPAETKQGEGK